MTKEIKEKLKTDRSLLRKYYKIVGNGVLRADVKKLNSDDDFRKKVSNIFSSIPKKGKPIKAA